MYTQFHRFVATVLLFSILLQSCGSPNLKMIEPVHTSDETRKPQQPTEGMVALHTHRRNFPPPEPTTSLPVAEPAAPYPTTSTSSIALPTTTPAESTLGATPSHGTPDTPDTQRTVTTPSQPSALSEKLSHAPRPLCPLQEASTFLAPPTAGHIAQNRTLAPQQMIHDDVLVGAHAPSVNKSSVLQTTTQAGTETIPHADGAVLPLVLGQRYLTAQNHQVSFREEAGVWKAQVQDVWRRTQVLPVLCAPGRTLVKAIEALASKTPNQHKYEIHILETDQPPWAPRVVYVGAMGLRGGGNSASSGTCPYGYRIRARDSSSDEDNDYTAYSSGYNLYRNTNDNWDHRRYWVRSDYPLPALSANDVREATWYFHNCSAAKDRGDCLYPVISCDRIMRLREQRREERKERREVRKRKQEEAERKRQEEERKKQEEANTKIVASRRALVDKIATEEAKTAKESMKRFFKESPAIQKRQAQMERALKSLSASSETEQTHTQEYVSTPYLDNADGTLAQPVPDDKQEERVPTVDENNPTLWDVSTKEKANEPRLGESSSNRLQQQHFNNPASHKGLPNVGDTCYLNVGLQVMARLYPSLVISNNNHANTTVRYGQAILDKLTNQDMRAGVTTAEAEAFRDILMESYNVGKGTHDQLHAQQQEDAAPVFNFLLDQCKATEVEFYSTKVHPAGKYATTTNHEPSTGTTLGLPLPTAPLAIPMNQLVADTLRGEHASDVIWEQPERGPETRDDAFVGNRLSIVNLHALHNRILPIWVHRFRQIDNGDVSTAEKISTPITSPFLLNIEADHLIEAVPYTGKLVGFIHHTGGLHSGHYTAYVQDRSGDWVCYDDTIVTTLDSPPLQEAQEAYLYFYKAVDATPEEVASSEGLPQHPNPIATQPPLVAADTIDAEAHSNNTTVEGGTSHNAQWALPGTQPYVGSASPDSVEDTPDLAQARVALQTSCQAKVSNTKPRCRVRVTTVTSDSDSSHTSSDESTSTEGQSSTPTVPATATINSPSLHSGIRDVPDLARAKAAQIHKEKVEEQIKTMHKQVETVAPTSMQREDLNIVAREESKLQQAEQIFQESITRVKDAQVQVSRTQRNLERQRSIGTPIVDVLKQTQASDDTSSLASSIASDQAVAEPSKVAHSTSTTPWTTQTPTKDEAACIQARAAMHNAQQLYIAEQKNREEAKRAYQKNRNAVAQAKASLIRLQATDSEDNLSAYDSALEEESSVDTEDDFLSTFSSSSSIADTDASLYGIWPNDALAHVEWDGAPEQEIPAHTDADSSPRYNNVEVADEQSEISARATSPPVAAEQAPVSPGTSPRSVVYPLPTFRQMAKAITVPFDNRPLAPLVQSVDGICMQLTGSVLGMDQLTHALTKGQTFLKEMEQQPYNTCLDWQERIQRKTLTEKLSCHVRLYQCLSLWTAQLTEEEQQAFEALIVPILQQHFLHASTEIQQKLLTYWENGGQCYTDILQEAEVPDWLSLSLYREIVCEALVTNNTLLQEQFEQRLNALIQHKEGRSQKKFLVQLLGALRDRQQVHQLDLLALCDLMEWLPADDPQVLSLLSNPSPDWYPTLKAYTLQPQLAVFADRYPPENRSVLSDLLARLPWSKAIIDIFLQSVAEEQDHIALKSLLLFLAQYPIEDNKLLDVFHTDFPENTVSPSHFLRHLLACELLKEIIKAFGQHTQELNGQITTWLQDHLDTFDALYACLITLKGADTATPVRSEQALQLREVLTLLNDYGATSAVGKQAFQALTQQPLEQWESTTHQLVISATFRASRELSVEELIKEIADNAPGVYFAGDAKEIRSSYEKIQNAYHSTATMLPKVPNLIASWSRNNIQAWAKAVKAHYDAVRPNKLVSQEEVLAVLRRAVELTHGFTPRATQLLSVLTLLNTPEKKGRLAQIYTGEGKSLIVAMLATVHALQSQKVDVLTTSAELSIPEVKKQTPFFTLFGLTAGENSKKNATEDEARRAIYAKDIVYGTAEDFQADIINTKFYQRDTRGDRGFGVVLVDEVDSMLYDGRNWNTQLSGLSPAMNHLTIVLGTIWYQVNKVVSHLRTIDGQCYFITAEKFEDIPGGGIRLPEGNNFAECSEPVDDQIAYTKKKIIDLFAILLRPLTPTDRKNLEAYKVKERRVKQLQEAVQEDEEASRSALNAASEALKKEPWYQEATYLEVPSHLQEFARKQVPRWVENAIHALVGYKKGEHYLVQHGKIVPVDYSNTGVLQRSTVLDNGLHQFLQIKEGFQVTPEGVSTNFLSKPGYFKHYEDRIYGLTGTLGNATTRSFLSDVYGVDMVNIPSYKQREITGNEGSCYRCKELTPHLVTTTSDGWQKAIIESALRPARNGQAVLVLCKHVKQVSPLKEALAQQYNPEKLFDYTGEKDFNKHHVDSGEIILATNIAGRGTDLTTSEAVEAHGGLHVCITFLPDSYRVELQNAGRTARQGKARKVVLS